MSYFTQTIINKNIFMTLTRTGLTSLKAKQDWARPSNHCRSLAKQRLQNPNNSCSIKTTVIGQDLVLLH